MTRVLTVTALVAAIVATAFLLFGESGDYAVDVRLDTAGQLVEGNQVKVGGVPVGSVEEIRLDGDARARLTLSIEDDEFKPLHEGSRVTIRQTSLTGIANRYVSLTPGPSNADEIEDGGEIPADHAEAPVDLDLVLNTLGPATRADLAGAIRGSAGALDGRGDDLNRALLALNPALSQSAITERELLRDQRAFERLVVESADAASAIAQPRTDLEQLTGNTLGALGALARRSDALESAIGRLPGTLRRANTTLVNLRRTIEDLRPTVREARPPAPLLSKVLTRLEPIARDARPQAARLRKLIDRRGGLDLLGALERFGPLAERAEPALASAAQTVEDALPVLGEARPYTPDLVGGLMNGFGGTTGGYYDANGRYVRISFQSSVYSLTNVPSLVPLPPAQQGLTGYRKGVDKRCPGAAAQTAPDGSNPYVERDDFPCDREDSPE